MEKFPESGTDSSLHATFRLVLKDSTSLRFSEPKDFIGKSVMLEPFNFPGMVVAHQGEDESLGISDSSDGKDSVFRLVPGLDGKAETVSLESQEGCFVIYKSSSSIKISCKSGSSNTEFDTSASFVMRDGISKYHPMSFIAKGLRRNFLLTPLLSLRDESYTPYFNIQS